jgi:hypothetical protein
MGCDAVSLDRQCPTLRKDGMLKVRQCKLNGQVLKDFPEDFCCLGRIC